MKDAQVACLRSPLGPVSMTLPKLLLSLLLFNAGLRVRLAGVGGMARSPWMILGGLATNLTVPLLFLAATVPALRAWHDPDEAAIVLVGLALVAAMPIAGSSTGWAQAADGDMELSLGLVLGSTLLSPLTTPASLHALAAVAPGHHGEALHRLAGRETGAFLAAWVLLPSFLGIAIRTALDEGRAAAFERRLKVVAPVTLLLLGDANASSCLPEVLGCSRWDFLGLVLTFAAGLCIATFAAGYILARVVGADRGQRVALMFGLGMNNNGTGLVLASLALGSQPLVLLPIIAYNLTQHLVAGCVRHNAPRADTGRATRPVDRPGLGPPFARHVPA